MSISGGILEYSGQEQLRAEIEKELENVRSNYRFNFFFSGLVFAILSFAIQFPVKGDTVWIKIIEAVSWIVIGLTGILALKQMGGFSLKNATATRSGLSRNWQFTMWTLFLYDVSLLLLSKIVNFLICYIS